MRELTDVDVAGVSLPAVVAEVGRCLADLGTGAASQAPKAVLPTGPGAFFLSLAGVVPRLGLAAAKWASYAPGAPGRPGTSTSTVVVSDASDGTPLAVVAGMAFTRVRTAATAVAVARAASSRPPRAVAFVGCGATNRAVLDALLASEPAAAVRVLVRTAASARALHAELAPRVPDLRIATDAAVLADADWAFSATGAQSPVADVAALAPDATVVALDGARTWHRQPGVPVLDDQVRPGAEAPAVPRLLAGLVERPRGPVLLDVAGSAVCDVALAACLPGVRT